MDKLRMKTTDHILIAVADYLADHGYAPVITDLMAATGIMSKGHVHYHLRGLATVGLITRTPGKARTLRLTDAGEQRVAAMTREEMVA